jgi:protein-L-isoaspartate O-methyltransferase
MGILPLDLQAGPATEPAVFDIDQVDLPAFRKAVAEIAKTGLSETVARDRLGLSDIADLQWKSLPMYRQERLLECDALAVAIDLFLLQGTVPARELDRLFSKPSQDVLLRTGLLAIDASGFTRARASLYPVADRLIFSDHAWHKLPHPGYKTVPSDQVMFVGKDSRWLARATVRRPVRTALDLCTGSGVQAILAAPHCERVLAVDVNPRAARCARFNTQVSGASNVEVILGDLFDAVNPTERFDLITANPPFVPSPVDELQFRDGGRSGEAIQRRIVAGLPRYLAPGGMAQMVTEVGEREDEPIVNRVRQWLEGAPLDIHILRLRVHTAADYAIGHGSGDGDFGFYLDSVGAWADNLRAQGYVRIVSALIAFQWSDPALGPPWDRVDESQPPKREAGPEVEAVFCAERTARQPNRGEALDRSSVRRAGPVALQESQVLGAQIHTPARATLLGQALSVEHQLDPVEREILRRLEKTVAVSELLAVAGGSSAAENTIRSAIESLLRRGLVTVSS